MKKSVYSLLSGVGVGTLVYFLLEKNQTSNKDNHSLPIEKAGKPELDQFENSKMVSEGSQFGVNYYNRMKQS